MGYEYGELKLQMCDRGRNLLCKATFSRADPEQYRNVTKRYGNVIERSLEHSIYRKHSSDKVKKRMEWTKQNDKINSF